MSIRLLSLWVLVAVLGSACGTGGPVESEPSGAAAILREEPSSAPTGKPHERRERPRKASTPPTAAPSGNGIRVSVPSHCGVTSAWVEGELWLATPPLGGHNPPPGWGENETAGYFVVTGAGQGEFHGDGGQKARFHKAEADTPDSNAGCE